MNAAERAANARNHGAGEPRVRERGMPLTTQFATLLIGASFAVGLGYGAVLPLMPMILVRIDAADVVASAGLHAGGLTSAYMFALFTGSFAWGRAADRLGIRAALLAGLVGYALSLVAVAAATVPAWAYALRALAGFFAGAVPPLAGAFAAADPDPVRRARMFAATGAATLVGLLAGPALSGGVVWLMEHMPGAGDMSAATLFWSMGAPASIALAVAFAALRTPDPEKSAGALTDPLLLPSRAWARCSGLFVASFLVLFGLGAFEVMLPLLGPRTLGLDAGSLALLFAECSAVMLAVQAALFFSPALARVPGRAVIAVGFALMAVGAAGLALARTGWGAYAAIAVLAFASGWLLPAIGYLASSAGSATGTLLGALTGLGVLGQAVGSLVGGWLYDRAAAGALWLLAAVLAAGVAIAFRREFDPHAALLAAPAGEHDAAVGRRFRAMHPRWTGRRHIESCASGHGTARGADDIRGSDQ